jgi:hypothetical protein
MKKTDFIDYNVEPERWTEAYLGDLRLMNEEYQKTQTIKAFKSRFYKILFNSKEASC